MMKKFKWISIALIAAMLVFSLVGCETDTKPVKPTPKPEPTNLALIKDNGLALTDSEVELSDPISEDDWDYAESLSELEDYFGTITIYSPVPYLGNITKLDLTKNAQATVFIASIKNDELPDPDMFTAYDSELTIDEYGAPDSGLPTPTVLTAGYYLFVKVENSSASKVNYYIFTIIVEKTNNNAKLGSITVKQGSRTQNVTVTSLNVGNISESFAESPQGEVNLTGYDPAEDTLVTYTFDHKITTGTPIQKVEIGKAPAASASTVPTLTDVTEDGEYTNTFTDGDVIYILVTAESGAKCYYKIQVQVGRNNRLTSLSVRVGTEGTIANAVLGQSAETWDAVGIGGGGSVTPVGGKTNFTITATPEDATTTITYAVGGDETRPEFTATNTGLTFVHNQFIWVKVETTTNFVRIYKIQIKFSSNANLVATETVDPGSGSDPIPTYFSDGFKMQKEKDGTMLGLGNAEGALAKSTFTTLAAPVPADRRNGIGFFSVNMLYMSLTGTIKLDVVLAADSQDATIKYSFGDITTFFDNPAAVDAGGTNWRTFNGSTMDIPSTEGYYIFVKVTAADDTTVKYYVGRIVYLAGMTINWGSPVINGSTIDSMWNDNVKYPWNYVKAAAGDSGAGYKTMVTNDDGKGNAFTWGRAKLAWDDSGVYIYIIVRKGGTTTTVYPGGSTGSNAHLYDSVELFINERVDASDNVYTGNGVSGGSANATNSAYAGRGGQYRLTPTATATAMGYRSGEPALATTGFNNSTNFPSAGWTFAATETYALGDLDAAMLGNDTGAKGAGYALIFKVPWRFATSASGADTGTGTPSNVNPPAPWPPKNTKQIGVDIQINVVTTGTGANAAREGVMVWQNTITGNYQNCKNWGVATLVGKPTS